MTYIACVAFWGSIVGLTVGWLAGNTADAEVTFHDKTITMLIGSETGGGTDASGRVVAPFLAKYLPGNPAIVVRNMPGADGMTALNFLMTQTKPDGLTVTTGSSTQMDPLMYRKASAHFDPSQFAFEIGRAHV